MNLRQLLRPRILAVIFGGYMLAIAVIAALFANGPGSGYRYTPTVIQWSYGVYFLMGGVLLAGIALVAAMNLQPLRTPLLDVEAEPESEMADEEPEGYVADTEDYDRIPPPLAAPNPGGDRAERDIDELLTALGDMETSLDEEEGVAVVEVPQPAAPRVEPVTRSRRAAAPTLVRSATRQALVGAYFLGPALIHVGLIAVSAIVLPGADAFLQTYNQLNTALLLGIAYSFPGIALYTGLSIYGILTHA